MIYCFFIWRILNPSHPRILCAKFGRNWLGDSGEEDFLISSMYFHHFVIISPLKRKGPFIWTNWSPFTQGCFEPRLVQIGPVVLERRVLKVVNLFLLFPNYPPFEKGMALHLNKLESLPPRDTLCQVWLKLAQLFWRRRWKCEKFTDRRTDRQMTGDQKSSL